MRGAGGRRYDRVEYHPHARLRMRQRRVSERQVERVIDAPDRTGPRVDPPGRIVAEVARPSGTPCALSTSSAITARPPSS